MVSRTFKFRIRRLLRLRRIQVEELSVQAEEGLEKNFFKRLDRLVGVRRFIFSWFILMFLLATITIAQIVQLGSYFQSLQPVPGGGYSEGIIGQFTNANPIYAQNPVDQTVSNLVFAGLFKYNDQNKLVGDLAQSITNNTLGTVYTVKLKPDLTWQDGQPLSAQDVVFTYHVIQNPDAQSPLYNSWQNVTVAEVNQLTVSFTLSNPLASFPYHLTNGIIPYHLLNGTSMVDLRSSGFNTEDPVGAGPFSWGGLAVTNNNNGNQNVQIALKPFGGYNGGKPKLDSFNVQTFSDQTSMLSAFNKQDINAMAGLDQPPGSLKGKDNNWQYNFPETAAVMTFFRTTDGVLQDNTVRQALVQGSNTESIIQSLGYPADSVIEPLLRGQLGFNTTYAQSAYNINAAKTLLNNDGWVVGKGGFRYKNGTQLGFNLYTEDTSEYDLVANELSAQWKRLGVNVQVISQDAGTFQNTLNYHSYDALLCGISIGVDPDVFVYWDSLSADVRSPERLNFSEYSNATVDDALEAGRTRLDPAERVIKYQAFLQKWQEDVPALGLYQPRYLYITKDKVYGLNEHAINVSTDRFDNVQNWEIREVEVTD